MKLNGYQIKEALRNWGTLQQDLAEQLESSFYYFEGDEKLDPLEIEGNYLRAEQNVAKLEEIQQEYNLQNKIQFDGQTVTLAFAIKAIGRYSRLASIWKKAGTQRKERRSWMTDSVPTRSNTDIVATKSLTDKEVFERRQNANKLVAELRQKIGAANAVEVEFDIPEDLVVY